MKKLLIIITIITCAFHLHSQNFQMAGNLNNWTAEPMVKSSSGSDVYKLTKILAAGNYQYQTLKDGVWPKWWEGVNRPFTLTQSKTVTFYARKEGYSSEYGKDWMFFCDAQDFYLCGDVVGSWNNLSTVKKMTVSGSKATYTGYLNSGNYQVRINSQYGLVDNDVMIFSNHINQAGNYRIELDFETMLVTAYALRINTTLDPIIRIGNPAALKSCTADGFQNSNIDINYGESFLLGAELTTRPVSSDVTVKLHYALKTIPERTGTLNLNWVSDHPGLGTDYDSKWGTATSIDIAQGLSAGTYSLEFYYTASDGVHTLTNQYNSDNPYRIYLNVKQSSLKNKPVEVNLPTDQNYIKTRTYTEDDRSYYLDGIQYFDGLGRPNQTIQVGVSGTDKKDLVSLQTYDDFGREKASWLPIPNAGRGSFIQAEDEDNLTDRFTEYYNYDSPFSRPVYEPSPLNRVLEQYGPGQDWQDKGKSVKTKYLTNNNSYPCKWFKISADGNSVTTSGNYPNNELFVMEMSDEDGNLSYEFKDKLGQVVLTRQMNGSTSHDTYYVYDDFGNLRFVLPPLAADANGSSESLNLYGYKYKYDNRKRCTYKKLPGCEPILYVYDKADQLILSQDGEQRKEDMWVFNKYDGHGRLVITGIFKIELPHEDLIAKYKDIVVKEKFDKWNKFGYTWSSMSEVDFTGTQLVNHYDDYEQLLSQVSYRDKMDFTEKESFGKRYINQELGTASAKGMLVGTRETINGDIYKQIITTFYYDERGRMVQRKSTNQLSGYDYEYIAYNFTGQPTKRRLEHTAPNLVSGATTEDYVYTYDYAGRLTKTEHSLNGGALVAISENEYDEFGRLKQTKANKQDNLTINYAYNIRSWTKAITSPLFKQELYYNEDYAGNIPSYSGNISAMTVTYPAYAVNGIGHTFEYDNLSQLTAARYFSTKTLVASTNTQNTSLYKYDKHGNIKSLQRGIGISLNIRDNVTFDYTGNQLKKATNDVPAYITENLTDYADEEVEYTFNSNGAMVQDKNKGTDITYSLYNGMPQKVKVNNPISRGNTNYIYTSTGKKLAASYDWYILRVQTPLMGSMPPATEEEVYEDLEAWEGRSKTINYAENKIYEYGKLERILIDNGYIVDGNYYFYVKDHLGNNQVVADAAGTAVQLTNYRPFGMPSTWLEEEDGIQPYKYNGKEYDQMHGLNQYDYHARQYDPFGIRFTSVDPLAEKYYSWSPYVYCMNNPLKFIDPDGRDGGVFPKVISSIKGLLEWNSSGTSHIVKQTMSVKFKQTAFGIRHPYNASYTLSRLKPTAERFGTELGLVSTHENAISNAIRHGMFQAMITRDLGETTAKQIGDAHEYMQSGGDTSLRSFDNAEWADETVDLLNNEIGRQIGRDNPEASNKDLASAIATAFKNEGMWSAKKLSSGDWTIVKTKLTQEQHTVIMNALKALDEDGKKKK